MRRTVTLALAVLILPIVAAACIPQPPVPPSRPPCPSTPAPGQGTDPATTVLVFSRTDGYRHDSIPAAIDAVRAIGLAAGWTTDSTEDPCVFNDTRLDGYGAIVFLLTAGDAVNDAEQAAIERFVQDGGGWVGVHSAGDTEHGWAWYGELVATRFSNHPPGLQTATVHVEDPAHAATVGYPSTSFSRTDEWYNFTPNPRPDVHVLLTIDESSYSGGTMGADHPVAWCHDFDGGRAFYTQQGHTAETYTNVDFRAHLRGGIAYALGTGGSC
jgi:type 1 glutamine amidotransferase